MSGRFLRYEPCPRCRAKGRDRAGDNLAVYADGSAHCFAHCGYHRNAKRLWVKEEKKDGNADKAVLPRDFTREIPAQAWKWLLQFGLPYSYWKPYCGYSEEDERLVFTVGKPTKFSIGRYCGTDVGERGPGERWVRRPPRKWHFYGDGHGYVELLGSDDTGRKPVVLVEDLISAHKVAQVYPSICLFGTNIHAKAIQALMALKRPTMLWLDEDQYTLLPPKINRLQTFLTHPVRFVSTEKDPKAYSLDEIKEILDGGTSKKT